MSVVKQISSRTMLNH